MKLIAIKRSGRAGISGQAQGGRPVARDGEAGHGMPWSLIADAQERGLVGHNAVREMAKRRGKGKERQGERRRKTQLQVGVDIPTPDEIRAIIESVKGRWRPFLVTAIFTGLRASELRGLRWSDVDLKHGTHPRPPARRPLSRNRNAEVRRRPADGPDRRHGHQHAQGMEARLPAMPIWI